MTKLKLDFKESEPYFGVYTAGFQGDILKFVEDLVRVAQAFLRCIVEVLKGELPKLVDRAIEVGKRIGEVGESAKGEAESLGGFDKIKALKAIASDITELKKVEPLITGTLAKYKRLFAEISEAVKDVHAKMASFEADGKKCAEKGVKDCHACYVTIHGPIKYKAEERKRWEYEMIGWHRSRWFWPSDIHHNDEIK